MSTLTPPPKLQFFDINGDPLSGGKLYTYAAGTTTPLATYTDSTGGTPNANPVILNSRGEASVWWGTSMYKMMLTTATDVEIWTVDNMNGTDPATIASVLATLAASSGSSLIGYTPSGSGAVATTAQAKMREVVSVFDFMTAAEVADAQSNTASINVTSKVQAALTYATTSNRALHIPSGTYKVANLSFNSTSQHIDIYGDGSGNTVLKNTVDSNPVITITSPTGTPNQLNIRGIAFSGNGSVTGWGTGNGVAGNNLVGTIPTTTCAVSAINLVHSMFIDCYFMNSTRGVDLQGGIGVAFLSCYAYWNGEVGFMIRKSATSGYPNLISLRDSHAIENGMVGIYFDQGRGLFLDGCDVEGNGKNTVIASSIACGLFVGSQTGLENGATNGPAGTPFHTLAATVKSCWFEQNGNNNGAGVPSNTNTAHIIHQHGYLEVDGCLFTNVTAGRTIRINGGQYSIQNSSFESGLTVSTNQIDEALSNAGLVAKNVISNCFYNVSGTSANLSATYCTVDLSKVTFDYVRYPQKLIQTGSVTTSSGVASVTFPTAFTTLGAVQCQPVVNDNGAYTYSVEVSAESSTGFSVRTKRSSAGSVTSYDFTVTWLAVGV